MHLAVTITSDFICPWCYIGETNLFAAIARLPVGTQVDVGYRPFELNPATPAEGMSRRAYRIGKFGSWERSLALDAQVAAAGAAAGLAFNYDRIERTPNTILAHRVMWATANGGGDQATLARGLFKAYFTDGLDISDPTVLRRIAAASGAPMVPVDAVLDGDSGLAEVRTLTRQASMRGIQGVPFFEVGGFGLSGAQPADTMEQALLHVMAEQPAAA